MYLAQWSFLEEFKHLSADFRLTDLWGSWRLVCRAGCRAPALPPQPAPPRQLLRARGVRLCSTLPTRGAPAARPRAAQHLCQCV